MEAYFLRQQVFRNLEEGPGYGVGAQRTKRKIEACRRHCSADEKQAESKQFQRAWAVTVSEQNEGRQGGLGPTFPSSLRSVRAAFKFW